MPEKKIKIGIVLDSTRVAAWKYQLLEKLVDAPFLSVDVVLVSEPSPPSTHPPLWLRPLLSRLDQARSGVTPDACEFMDADALLSGARQLPFDPASAQSSRPAEPGSVSDLSDFDLDVIVIPGEARSHLSLSEYARCGVLYYDHDYGASTSGDCSSVGLWEVLEGRPYVASRLVLRRDAEPTDLVAYRTYSPVDLKSLIRTRNWHLWKSAFFVPRVLQRLHDEGSESFLGGLATDPGTSEPAGSRIPPPTLAQKPLSAARYVVSRVAAKLARKWNRERWQIMYAVGEDGTRFSDFRSLDPPDGLMWADPFVVRDGDGFAVFFEEAALSDMHGHLAVVTMARDGSVVAPPARILAEPHHLSYPFVFEWDGEMYLVPESGEKNVVSLYRFSSFPDRLEFVHHLMEGIAAYDATLVEHAGRWWMFANVRAHEGASDRDELCLFYADSPVSRSWQPHPLNPVVSDVRASRPAGRLFLDDGDLLRPSQNSSYRYGYGLNFSRIVDMTPATYREEIVGRYEPDWSGRIVGLHTWNRCGEITVIDAICRTQRRRVETDPS